MDSTRPGEEPLSSHRELAAARTDPLVGRSHELQMIERLLDRTAAGTGGALLIEGAAGLGKSRLLAAAAARARAVGVRVLDARAIEPERGFPFAIALQLFEPALAVADDGSRLFDGAAGLARALFSGDYTNAIDSPFPLQHGLFWLTVNLARAAPLLLCIDDAQWSDDGSLGFVRYLVRRVEDLPITLIIATRPPGSLPRNDVLDALRESWTYEHARLKQLNPDEVAAIVRAALPQADESFCAACADVTRGNPFHLREVLRTVAAEGIQPTTAYSQRLREVAFASVSRASLFRLARLGADPIALARALSVLGDGAPLRRTAALAGLDLPRAAAAADALVAEELLAAGPTMTFAHPLIGQLVHDEIPAMEAGLANGRAARLLAAEGAAPEAVAAHLLHAPAEADPWVTETLRHAARRTRAKGVPVSAAQLLVRAVDEPPPSGDLADVLAELGSAEAAAGRTSSIEHLRQALDLRTTATERTEARLQLARALAAHGRRREAAEILQTALDENGDGAAGAALLTDYLVNAVFEPGLRQAAFSRTRALRDAPPSGGTPAERGLLAAMAMRSGQDGGPAATTTALADRAWSDGALLAEQGADGPGWLMVVWSLELAGDHARAELIALAAVEAARATGSMEAFATASMFCAWARSSMGRLVDAEADIEQALTAGELGWRRYLVAALSRKAELRTWRGDLVAAATALASAEEYDKGSGMETPWRLQASGQLAMAQHDPTSALRLFLAAGTWLSDNLDVDYTVLTWRADAARAAHSLGDDDQARELLAHDTILATRCGAPGHLGRVMRVHGLIAGDEEGMTLLRHAVELLAEAGESLERAATLTDLGALLRRNGARAEARPYLTDALDYAVPAGAGTLAARARDELAATGVRRRLEQASGPPTLTPSQRRVAQLVSDGLTNTQVAQALFVTPKTVEYHLRHVYQKLAITNRRDIPAALARVDGTA